MLNAGERQAFGTYRGLAADEAPWPPEATFFVLGSRILEQISAHESAKFLYAFRKSHDRLRLARALAVGHTD
jgi:hypothetical protein